MNRLSFSTSTSLLVQQLVPSGTLALEADWSICADVGAAAVVYQALIQPWRVEREREKERERERERERYSHWFFSCWHSTCLNQQDDAMKTKRKQLETTQINPKCQHLVVASYNNVKLGDTDNHTAAECRTHSAT